MYKCPCGKKYTIGNSVITHINKKYCGVGNFKVKKYSQRCVAVYVNVNSHVNVVWINR